MDLHNRCVPVIMALATVQVSKFDIMSPLRNNSPKKDYFIKGIAKIY